MRLDWTHEGDMARIKTGGNVEDASDTYEYLCLEYPNSVETDSELKFWEGYHQLKHKVCN